MDCVVCGHPAWGRKWFCKRCHKFACKTRAKKARRLALTAAWSKEADAFLCHYTGVKLEEYDTSSPFYLTFDHPIPGDNTKLLVCARFINELKQDMTEEQFRRNIPLLAEHFKTGAPIDRSLFQVGEDTPIPEPVPEKATSKPVPCRGWYAETCVICGKEPIKGSIYCTRCRNIMINEPDRPNKRPVLKAAYDPAADGFRCQYTGFLLDIGVRLNPWHLNFDHRRPGVEGDYVVTCRLINDMKTELSDEEFKKVVIELAKHFETGEPYNRDVIKFEYWDRPRMPGP